MYAGFSACFKYCKKDGCVNCGKSREQLCLPRYSKKFESGEGQFGAWKPPLKKEVALHTSAMPEDLRDAREV